MRKLPLSADRKVTVTYRVEPGCLGPKGPEHIDDFCRFAQKEVALIDSDYVKWNIVPRFDKSIPEMQYSVVGKSINHQQARKYLKVLDKSLDDCEEHLIDKMTVLIDQFFER